ncbi:dihydroorotate dehydrogenase [Qingshengfaniella alkalisoli]|uniref:Dihydroorotate dehydrogenase n=1 Tax=Qingshengfaniella alkalisoli TaxID=2599296 RepID=A0A5B8J4C9_9RHOB|nr:dihydroorotate dehydrogenase [Qingshengfaniella alkalisoli]QDY69377.1 dihydroorotate dehydrogenase [Qingshengfaniella alkalisoli]
MVVDLTTKVGSLTLKNPIMPASGTFSEELAEAFDLEILGAHVTKTFTAEIRGGNPTPRVCEVQGSMLNSIGIPSKGLEYFVRRTLPYYQTLQTPLVVSISANSADEFAELCTAVSLPGVAAIEVNISCPNIEADGKAFAIRPSTTRSVMEKLRAATDLPLWAKLTPNTGETSEVAHAAEDAGADALVVANTLLAMAIDIETKKPKLGNLMGGLSGPAMKPIALRMAYQCAKVVDIPVIGCGGISNAQDVIEFMVAGATAVQVGTASFIQPLAMPIIIRDLEAYCAERNIKSLSSIVGTVIDSDTPEAVVSMEAAP